MREKGIVLANKKGYAQIKVNRTTACGSCRNCSLGEKDSSLKIWAKNPVNANTGQIVEIKLNVSTFLSATLIAYGFPLLAFLTGIIFGYKIFGAKTDFFPLLMGIGTMFVSFLCVHLLTKGEKTYDKYTSCIVKVLESECGLNHKD